MNAGGQIDKQVWLQNAWRNRMQSFFLLAAIAGFLALAGHADVLGEATGVR